jgi:hypothetical protein
VSSRDSPSYQHSARRALDAPPSQVAKGGAVLVLIVLVVAILMWAGVFGDGPARVDTSSASYLSGRHYANTHFSISTSQGIVCDRTRARDSRDASAWLQGCHDGWAVASFSSGVRGAGGPIP